MFSCEFYEISKNTYFTEHLWVTAFDDSIVCNHLASDGIHLSGTDVSCENIAFCLKKLYGQIQAKFELPVELLNNLINLI